MNKIEEENKNNYPSLGRGINSSSGSISQSFEPSKNISNNKSNDNLNNLTLNPTIKKYKKRILFHLILFMLACFALILERVFSDILNTAELKLIINFQNKAGDALGISRTSKSNFYKFFSFETKYLFLFYTHIYFTIFFGVHSIFAIKVMYCQYFGIILFNALCLLYSSPRPYWLTDEIIPTFCSRSFDQPDIVCFSLLFLVTYSYYCYKNKIEEQRLFIFHFIN